MDPTTMRSARPVLEDLTLSLPDIALTAGVQRPVVSMWRTRHAGGPHPFPSPVADDAGPPRFRASDVVAWVEATGLGKNPHFAADVAVRGVLDARPGGDRPTDGLLALLCLRSYGEVELGDLSSDEVLDLADELDPEDEFLYREVVALGSSLSTACALADLMASAAYSTGGAAEAVLADRYRAGRADLTRSALAPPALDVVARVVEVVAQADVVASPAPGCGDLLHAVLATPDAVEVPTAMVPPGEGRRLARRRLVAHGWEVRTLEDGDLPPEAVVVCQMPEVGIGDVSDEEVLARVDEVVLSLGPGQRAVVVGPASALVEAASSPAAESARSSLLRTHRLRTAVLLPPGLVVDRSRQRLALWVLGDAHPDVAIEDRWTMVADLSDVRPRGAEFDRAVLDDLLTDVVASLDSADAVRAHSFRFARFARLPQVLARGGSLVESARGLVQVPRDDGGAAAVRVRELVERLAEEMRPVLDVAVRRGAAAPVRDLMLGALVDDGRARRLPGLRLEPSMVVAAPERDPALTRVLGPEELAGDVPWGARAVDRLRLVADHADARLTEPGDVVVTTTPRPAAAVDRDGFSAVVYPAWVLRVRAPDDDGDVGHRLLPDVLAREIAAQPPDAKRWRSWRVRLLPPDQAAPVARALDAVADRAAAARCELARLEELAATLVDGVASGVVRIDRHADNPVGGGGQDVATE
ncbi:hypothetical protein M1843_00985 [Isoptericola sp. 4D.3]|uniref:N-6 DNA methylase n=1 Tax=Isoptericola peretonis TaxID=2918523 RepID=A0ABT0IYL7_9MICO|nr:hypothetical protein [Isoptericola sp. 4D.3]